PALLGLLDHADHAPALGRRHRPRLHDLDQVAHADLTGVVVDLDPVGPPHDLAIQRVGHPVLHGDHHGLGHLVADDVATPGLARVALYALGALFGAHRCLLVHFASAVGSLRISSSRSRRIV